MKPITRFTQWVPLTIYMQVILVPQLSTEPRQWPEKPFLDLMEVFMLPLRMRAGAGILAEISIKSMECLAKVWHTWIAMVQLVHGLHKFNQVQLVHLQGPLNHF